MIGVGIVRRIDELGRIVIPKEMRKTMRLKEGDEMEISSSGDALTLRKYSGLTSILPIIKSAAKLLSRIADCTALFVDTAQVVIAEGKQKKFYADEELSEAFSDALRERKSGVTEDVDYLLKKNGGEGKYAVYEPIIVGGDLLGGAVMILDRKPVETDKTYLTFSVELISAAMI